MDRSHPARARFLRRPLRAAGLAVAIALALGVAAGAARAEGRVVDLPLAGGKAIRGVVESADAREVVVRISPEEVRRVPWAQLTPTGVYRAREALASPTDGGARLALAELAADLGLHAETRAEYEKAFALGALEADRFTDLVNEAEHRAVEQGVRAARHAADSGDLDVALEVARRLKIEFTSAPNAKEVDRLIQDLVDAVRDVDAEVRKMQAEIEKAKGEAQREKEILERLTRSLTEVRAADVAASAAVEARRKGNVTKARKNAERADEGYMDARRDLGRLRRILPKDSPRREDVMARLGDIDRKQFDLLYATAKFHWAQRIYTRAEEYANRAAYVDPVHADLLDLRDQMREARIRYRFSDVTNARPIIR